MTMKLALRTALGASALALSLLAGSSIAAAPAAASAASVPVQDDAAPRVGLGQASAGEPAMIGKLRLTDPLVQQKYLNEPDMLRFLRGTYAEACTRGLVKNAAQTVQTDLKHEYTPEQHEVAGKLLESRRIWKMTSFEMEALYGAGYLNAANYCDCLMREVSDVDLVNPRKGLEVIEKLSEPVTRACQASAKDQTLRQVAAHKKAAKEAAGK